MRNIKITDIGMEEALEQIAAVKELGAKERGCLRLLSEEMFSMCREILGTRTLDFEMKQDGNRYVISVVTETRVDEKARDKLISVSSSGKNAANKGVKGMIGAVLESFSTGSSPSMVDGDWNYGMSGLHTPGSASFYTWSLSRYIEAVEDKSARDRYDEIEKSKNNWDGLERSIIANFADDVSIGVRNGKLEMSVTKTF